MNTHLCRSTNMAGTIVSTRHPDEAAAVAEQRARIASGVHYNVVTMPVPREELTDYPQPTPVTMTKEPRHRNDAPKRERAKVAA